MTLPDLHFSPLIPLWLLLAASAAGLFLLWRGARQGISPLPRVVCLSALLLALANPRVVHKDASEIGDIALLVVDDSASMHLGDRAAQSATALAELQKKLAALPNLETRVITAGGGPQDDGTRLFGAIDQSLADIPQSRLAGVIMLTDGQVHDVPDQAKLGAPLHVVLAGHRDDRDRRLVMENMPSFAMVGSQAEMAFHIDDPGHDGKAEVTLRLDGATLSTVAVPLNRSTKLTVPIEHAGANVVEIEVAAVPGELTLQNNRSADSVSGVRDRLRVLLLSGEPHPGERMWRNLLKADPMVDLVHFTILRSPDKEDRTPIQQLSLIAFPTRELFEEKLKDFDLIIFDRFRRRNILPPLYYRNIAEHVKSGGALLLVAGPELAEPDSPAGSALSDILPAKADHQILDRPFLPSVTELGRRHPLFQGLPGAEADPPHWGRWVRAVGSQPARDAEVVMSTPDGMPLLVLSHAGEGRVAQLDSDSAWLWGRGWEGGGPQAELLRRLAHWLMKEPELEENKLTGQLVGGKLRIERHGLESGDRSVTVTRPDGSATALTLSDRGNGIAQGEIVADQNGLWRLNDDKLTTLVAVGNLNPVEMGDVRATPAKLQGAVSANGGGMVWLEDGMPNLIRQPDDSRMAGSGWLGLRANGQQSVTATSSRPLLPGWLLLLLAAGGMALAWWRDAKR
jgi:hypothetical protein